MFILILSFCYNCPNPIYALIGFILILTILILSIRERKKKKNQKLRYVQSEDNHKIFAEKDVLGLDKTYVNYADESFRPANKNNLKYVVYIIAFMIGLLLIIFSSKQKKGPYDAPVIDGVMHQPGEEVNYYDFINWLQTDKEKKIDTLFPLEFKKNNILENNLNQ